MSFRELAKRLLVSFFIIFGCALLCMYIVLLFFYDGRYAINLEYVTAIIVLAVLTNMTQLVLYSKKELSHKQHILRHFIIIVLSHFIVITIAIHMDWISVVAVGLLVAITTIVGSFVLVHGTMHTKLEKAALVDPLTKAFNRRYFMQAAAATLSTCIKEKRDFSIIMIDLDHFKAVNDTYGHSVGDEVLKIAVARVQNTLSRETVVARYGGEEFIVMIANMDRDEVEKLAWRIRSGLTATPFHIGDLNIIVKASFGIASKEPNITKLSEIIDNSDTALYKAKAAGRDTVVYYTSEAK